MANLQAIRQRIRSVQNTQKITRAMQMVAGAKLRRSQEELVRFRPYAERLAAITNRFLNAQPTLSHPLVDNEKSNPDAGLGKRETAPVGLILIGSDTGLCGTYNERILNLAERFLSENPSMLAVCVGKKVDRFFQRRGIQPRRRIVNWGGRYAMREVDDLIQWLKQLYLDGTVSSWWVASTRFISALSWKPTVELFLPLERSQGAESHESIIAEPDHEAVADALLNQSVRASFKRIVLEAFTSEHSARMMAMRNATDNATEMVEHLTLVRNKARQAAITKELIEVVSGAEALK